MNAPVKSKRDCGRSLTKPAWHVSRTRLLERSYLWQSPKSKPQILIFRSDDPVTIKEESVEMLMHLAGSECPYSERKNWNEAVTNVWWMESNGWFIPSSWKQTLAFHIWIGLETTQGSNQRRKETLLSLIIRKEAKQHQQTLKVTTSTTKRRPAKDRNSALIHNTQQKVDVA